MTYKPSPKPDFDKPTHIKYDSMETYIWGDDVAGKVKDWIFVSNLSLHQIIFGMEPRGNFKHSDQYRTIFGADELLYVLSGVLIINNPENGETHKVESGEAVFLEEILGITPSIIVMIIYKFLNFFHPLLYKEHQAYMLKKKNF